MILQARVLLHSKTGKPKSYLISDLHHAKIVRFRRSFLLLVCRMLTPRVLHRA